MARFLEHPSKPASYADGEFLVYPGALEENATVWFAFDKDEQGEPLWEGVLAICTAPDRAELVGVPLWTYNVNLGDVVELIESGEGAPVATRTIEPSTNATFRVFYPDLKRGDEDERWRQLIIDMEPWGCWFDVYEPGYLAIAAPARTAATVEEYLTDRHNAGDFIYERGRQP